MKAPTFSFVIPALNEAADIAATLEATLAQRLPASEVIVVDGGSTDGTREIVRRYAGRGPVRLLEQRGRTGVGAARNAGIHAATGDVIVALNADVRPPPDFLERLAEAYVTGHDCVSVESRVENLSDAFGRFIQAEHELRYGPGREVGWTEGFSCRRELALRAPFPEEIPGAGGEDVVFFDRLRALGAAWRLERSIVVTHRTPSTLRDFWRQWRGRGRAVPYLERRVFGLPAGVVVARRALAALWSLTLALTVVGPLLGAWRRARRSPRGLRDLPAFWALDHVRMAAHRSGEWAGLLRMAREGRAQP
ncbi:MAG TPA: glycosyltransferase [Dehalococcoidia bacterium]|nr:glycosyltransferase [Dehalococcoidia bacterium]